MKFERGERVEIMSMEEGFEGSFYPAVVISSVSTRRYIVQYLTLHHLVQGYDVPLREFRSELEIRPIPPRIDVSEYNLNDKVDAFCNDGWWVGKIIGINQSAAHDHKYVVSFDYTDEEIGFALHELRVHQQWLNDQWCIPKKRGRPRKTESPKTGHFRTESRNDIKVASGNKGGGDIVAATVGVKTKFRG